MQLSKSLITALDWVFCSIQRNRMPTSPGGNVEKTSIIGWPFFFYAFGDFINTPYRLMCVVCSTSGDICSFKFNDARSAEYPFTEDFERNLQIAMETKGYVTPADLRPIPISEFLRRLSGSKSHAKARCAAWRSPPRRTGCSAAACGSACSAGGLPRA